MTPDKDVLRIARRELEKRKASGVTQELARAVVMVYGELGQFRRALIEDLKAARCEVAAIAEEPVTVCLTVALGRIRALEEKVRRLGGA